ncbi:MAG: colicin transporter, partial [Bifidobacterium crudilactis]|nr:colicin transporter [Bifidobacterium crudilactis]
LDMAVKAVVASRDAKSLADAKGGLEQAVKDAQGTFDSSDGKVADTATRDRLREALDAANKVLADESVKDPKRYQDAQASLADPVNQVNESVNAKASADQAAAAAAAQAQAQAPAPAQSQPRQRSSSGSGSGSSSPRRSSGSTGSGSSNHGSTGSGTTPNTGSPSWSVPGAGSDSGNFSGTDPGL